MKYFIYTLLSIVLIMVVLLIIAILRALIIKKEYVAPNKINGDLNRKDEFASKFSKLVKCNTVTYGSEKDNARFIEYENIVKEVFPLISKNLEKIKIDNYNFLYKWSGKDQSRNPILLMGHSDVVPASKDGWDRDPFSGDYENGRVYGRGSFDNKSSFFSFMQAVEDLLEENYIPEVDVYLASTTDEEQAGVGAPLIVEYLKRNNIHLDLALDEGGAIIDGVLPTLKAPFAVVGILEKGFANIEFTATGAGGHSSTPSRNSPLVRLGRFMNDVEKKKPLKVKFIPEVQEMFEKMAPYMSFTYRLLFTNFWLFKPLLSKLLPSVSPYGGAILGTTCAFTMAKGSDAPNVIPTNAKVIANIRTHPIQDINSSLAALNEVGKKHKVTGRVINGRESTKKIEKNQKNYIYINEIISKVFPDVGIAPYVITGRTDAREYEEVCDCSIRFSPSRITNDDLKKMHGLNESMSINSIIEAITFFKELIKNYK